MRAKPIKRVDGEWVQCEVREATHVEMRFPLDIVIKLDIDPPFEFNIFKQRILPIQLHGSRADTCNWSWNGDTEMPTLRPSILTTYQHGDITYRCHSFVNNGIIQFLEDCTHDKAGTFETLLPI